MLDSGVKNSKLKTYSQRKSVNVSNLFGIDKKLTEKMSQSERNPRIQYLGTIGVVILGWRATVE